jgi:hypothetical protein
VGHRSGILLCSLLSIFLHPESTHPWDAALNRALAVMVGCLLGWGLTYVFQAMVEVEAHAVDAEAARRDGDS